jgi:DNA repair exonuclease SbcCD ATPase subunit
LSEEQAKSRGLQEKLDSLEKQLENKQEVEKELEKTKGKVSELNRRFQDATRAYEQEKRVSNNMHVLEAEELGRGGISPSLYPPPLLSYHPTFVSTV